MGRPRASSTERRNTEGRFPFFPLASYYDKRLTATDRDVLGLMGSYASKDRPAYPYAIDLARTLGISERTVRRSIETLTATEYLRPTTYNGRRAWSVAAAAADCRDLPDEFRRWTPWLDHDPKPDIRDRNKPNSGHPRPELTQNRTSETGINGPTQNRTSEIPKPDTHVRNLGAMGMNGVTRNKKNKKNKKNGENTRHRGRRRKTTTKRRNGSWPVSPIVWLAI